MSYFILGIAAFAKGTRERLGSARSRSMLRAGHPPRHGGLATLHCHVRHFPSRSGKKYYDPLTMSRISSHTNPTLLSPSKKISRTACVQSCHNAKTNTHTYMHARRGNKNDECFVDTIDQTHPFFVPHDLFEGETRVTSRHAVNHQMVG